MIAIHDAFLSLTGCGSSVNLITTEGEITSPNYPGDYPNDANCRWKIRAPQGKVHNHYQYWSPRRGVLMSNVAFKDR